MPLSSKFFTESTGGKIVKIDQYLAKIWTRFNSLLFWPTLYSAVQGPQKKGARPTSGNSATFSGLGGLRRPIVRTSYCKILTLRRYLLISKAEN